MNMKSFIKLLIIIVIILNINKSCESSAAISRKKTIIDTNLWCIEWIDKNKNKIISLSNQQLKQKLYQELVKYSGVDHKTFNQILSVILKWKKDETSELIKDIKSKKKLYFIRF